MVRDSRPITFRTARLPSLFQRSRIRFCSDPLGWSKKGTLFARSGAMNPLAGRYLTVVVGGKPLAIELSRVREIVGYLPMLPPGAMPSHVKGWIDYRGRSIRVIDLNARLGVGANVQTEDT